MPTIVKIMPNAPRSVVALAYDRLCTFEFGIAVEIFGLPRPELGADWYRFAVAAIQPGPLRATGGIAVVADGDLSLVEEADLIIVPGWRGIDEPVPDRLIDALRRAHRRGARLASLCSGVFVLAATGLLDGRRATTHWSYHAALLAAYPALTIVPDVLYVDEGDILTAAGSAAAIDLGLHIIRRDFGADVANAVARRLVVPPHREGGQAQFIERPVPSAREGARLGPLIEALRREPAGSHDIASLARRAGMSERTFLRRFQATTGTTPAAFLTAVRLGRARELLETTTGSIETIAEAAGFGTAATLRHHFRRALGTSPAAYRSRFRRTDGAITAAEPIPVGHLPSRLRRGAGRGGLANVEA